MASILISLIVAVIVLGLLWWLVSMLPLPAPLHTIVRVLFILLAIVLILGAFGLVPGVTLPRLV